MFRSKNESKIKVQQLRANDAKLLTADLSEINGENSTSFKEGIDEIIGHIDLAYLNEMSLFEGNELIAEPIRNMMSVLQRLGKDAQLDYSTNLLDVIRPALAFYVHKRQEPANSSKPDTLPNPNDFLILAEVLYENPRLLSGLKKNDEELMQRVEACMLNDLMNHPFTNARHHEEHVIGKMINELRKYTDRLNLNKLAESGKPGIKNLVKFLRILHNPQGTLLLVSEMKKQCGRQMPSKPALTDTFIRQNDDLIASMHYDSPLRNVYSLQDYLIEAIHESAIKQEKKTTNKSDMLNEIFCGAPELIEILKQSQLLHDDGKNPVKISDAIANAEKFAGEVDPRPMPIPVDEEKIRADQKKRLAAEASAARGELSAKDNMYLELICKPLAELEKGDIKTLNDLIKGIKTSSLGKTKKAHVALLAKVIRELKDAAQGNRDLGEHLNNIVLEKDAHPKGVSVNPAEQSLIDLYQKAVEQSAEKQATTRLGGIGATKSSKLRDLEKQAPELKRYVDVEETLEEQAKKSAHHMQEYGKRGGGKN